MKLGIVVRGAGFIKDHADFYKSMSNWCGNICERSNTGKGQ